MLMTLYINFLILIKMPISKYINKTSDLSFVDLINTFNNISTANNVKFSSYYKSPEADINTLFKTREYINVEGTVLNISENINIPFVGEEISMENFKNCKQLGLANISYNNINKIEIQMNTLLTELGFAVINYDIIKISFAGNQIYSNNANVGAINIDVSKFNNCISLNMYFDTYITGCHGKSAEDRTNASNENGGDGESSTNAGDGIVITGTGNANFKINIDANGKLSRGFGGNGGEGGKAGRPNIDQVDATDEVISYRKIPETESETEHQYVVGPWITWHSNGGRTVREGAIFYGSTYYWVFNGEVATTSRSSTVIRTNNNTDNLEYSIISTSKKDTYIFNKLKDSSNKWYSSSYGESKRFDAIVYSIKSTHYSKESYVVTAAAAGVAAQTEEDPGNGESGSFPTLANNADIVFLSAYTSTNINADDGDDAPSGSRNNGTAGTGGTHGKSGKDIKNSSTNVIHSLF